MKSDTPVSTEHVTESVTQTVVAALDDILSPYIGVFFIAWAVTIVSTPLMRRVAIRFKIIDQPDLARKNHLEPIPYLGGIAIFLGWLAGVFLCGSVSPHLARYGFKTVQFPQAIVWGAIIITVCGLVDDVVRISPRVKLGAQLIAAGILASNNTAGTSLMHSVLMALHLPDPELIAGFPYTLSYALGAVVIALFVLGACNAVNLLDGLDGLATGVLGIACLGFLVISCYVAVAISNPNADPSTADLMSDPVRVVMCLAILGALLGFLPHNFNPANIFMGDAGSMLLGYLSATTILLFAHGLTMGPQLVCAALIIFALPITDTALTIFRRLMARQSIMEGDSQHLHHQIARGFTNWGFGHHMSVKLTVLTMYALSLIFAILGCALVFLRWRFVIVVFAVVFGFVVVMAYKSAHRRALLLKGADAVSVSDS